MLLYPNTLWYIICTLNFLRYIKRVMGTFTIRIAEFWFSAPREQDYRFIILFRGQVKNSRPWREPKFPRYEGEETQERHAAFRTGSLWTGNGIAALRQLRGRWMNTLKATRDPLKVRLLKIAQVRTHAAPRRQAPQLTVSHARQHQSHRCGTFRAVHAIQYHRVNIGAYQCICEREAACCHVQ